MFKRTKVCSGLMLAFGGTLTIGVAPAFAQQTLDRVEVTGSSIRRIESETSLPVTVITREEIAKTGVTTAAELLDQLSSNNGGGYNQNLAIGDGARPGFAGASLRGLGSNTTLILLNGRRLAVYAFEGDGTDLNSIALGAIDRIEVLRDGASAIYGTDAIAGVINFITKRDFAGFDITASMRNPQASGGGKSKHGSLTVGYGDPAKNGFNIFGNLTWDKYDALKAKDRDFANTAFLPNAPGGRFDRTSGNTFPASIVVPGVGTINPGVPNCLPPFSFQTAPNGACRFDYAATIDILTPQEKLGGLLRGVLPINKDHELFGEYNRTRTESRFAISPTPASGATTFNGDPVLYPAGGRHYPRAINPATGNLENGVLWYAPDGTQTNFVPLSGDLDIFWRSVEAGPRTNQSVATQDRIVLGGKGTILGKWDYDAAIMKTTSKVTESYVKGWLSESRLLNSTGLPTQPGYAVGTLNADINPFAPNDAVGLAALASAQVLENTRLSKSTSQGGDAKVSGEVYKLPAGAVSAAVGVEYREEKFDDVPLAVLGTGDIIGGGGNQLPVHGDRKIGAVFGEVIVPVIKGLEALAQVRHDKYSDFGTTTNPKLGLRWQPVPEILVRGSIGTGFRAPTLSNLYSAVTQTNTGNNYNDPYYEARVGDCYDATGNPTANFTPTFCNAQLTVNQGGNTNLKPEESRQQNLGIVFQPMRDVSVSVDYWKIKVKKQIQIPDADERLGDFIATLVANTAIDYDPTTAKLTPAAKAALNGGLAGTGIVRDPVSGNLDYVSIQYDNITETSTSGIDIGVNALLAKTAIGEFRGSLDATYVNSWKEDGTEEVGKYANQGPVVRWKRKIGVNWNYQEWGASLDYRWQSRYLDQGGTRYVAPYEIFDLAASYRPIKGLTVRAGIQNLFDQDPPYSRQGDYFHVGYDPTYADPRGRTFTLAVNYSF
jgi:iron complex outermembrane recepter protein